MPGWPLLAASTASIASVRIVLMAVRSRSCAVVGISALAVGSEAMEVITRARARSLGRRAILMGRNCRVNATNRQGPVHHKCASTQCSLRWIASTVEIRPTCGLLSQFQPVTLQVAFLRLVDDRQRLEGVFEAGRLEHQAADVAVEVQKRCSPTGRSWSSSSECWPASSNQTTVCGRSRNAMPRWQTTCKSAGRRNAAASCHCGAT